VRLLLTLPFLLPLIALGWVALDEHREGSGVGLPEDAVGRILTAGGAPRVVVLAERSPAAWVFDPEGRPVGKLDPPEGNLGSNSPATLPFIDGDRLLYLAGRSDEPPQVVYLGQLPLAGGARRAVATRLPAPVPFEARRGDPLPAGSAPLVLGCAPGYLVKTTRGWAPLGREDARPEGCRPLSQVPPPPDLPLRTRLFAEVAAGDGPLALGAAFAPPPELEVIDQDRQRVWVIRPPKAAPVWGQVLVAGPWVLFSGRSCRLGTLRLTLADLRERGRRESRWTVEQPLDPRPACDRSPVEAWVCDCGLRLRLSGAELAFRAQDGAAQEPGALRECRQLHPLRENVAPWEGARALRADGVRYLVESPRTIRAISGGRQLWRRTIPGPAWILGATDSTLLVVAVPDRLLVIDRQSGASRGAQQLDALWDPLEGRPSLTRWIGQVGERGYFLLVRSKRWLMRIRETALVVFDGERARVVD